MKLSNDFIAHLTDEQSVLVPVGGTAFSGIVKGNAALGDLLSLLEQDRTEAGLVAAMLERYDAPESVLAGDVHTALERLRAVGALEE